MNTAVIAVLAIGLVVVVGVLVWSRRNRTTVWTADRPSAPHRPATGGHLTCPRCGHGFTPPDITIVTEAQVRQYGPDPVQCPRCRHIWSAGRDIHRVTG